MANYTLPLGQLSLINHKSGSHQPVARQKAEDGQVEILPSCKTV